MTEALKTELANQIAKKHALVVVGTGVSLAATSGNALASWKGLIANGLKRCVDRGLCKPTWADTQNGLLEGDLDDLLGVAEQVSRRLGWKPADPCDGEWNAWLRTTVGALRAEQPELIQAIRDLGAPIATLNYDNLLTKITDRRPITWKNAERWLPVLQGNDEAILHLHGHWDQPSSVVLGIRSYDAVMGKELAQHLQRVLASLHSLVFIGCSGTVQDPNFSALIDWMRDQLRGAEHSHYLLLREIEPPPIEKSLLRQARIVTLRYGAAHTDLLPFIRRLAPSSLARKPATDTAAWPPGAPAPAVDSAPGGERAQGARQRDESRQRRAQENKKRLQILKEEIAKVLSSSPAALAEFQRVAELRGWKPNGETVGHASEFVDWAMNAKFSDVKDSLLEAHERLKSRRAGDDTAVIEAVSRLLLPWLYVASNPIDTSWWNDREALGNIVGLPCGLDSFSEIVMAGLERRELLWNNTTPNWPDWPDGVHRISCPPEIGIAPQLDAVVREELWRICRPPPQAQNKSLTIKKEAIRNQLKVMEKNGLKPYLIISMPEEDISIYKRAANKIRDDYPQLEIIKLDESMLLNDQVLFNEIRHLLVPGLL